MKVLIAIWALVLLSGAGLVAIVDYGTAPVHADTSTCQPSGKCLDDCTGFETVGHCADKCADPNDNLVGYDKETGAAICNAPPTGCPYGDAVPLGPECDRLAPASTTPEVPATAPVVAGFEGK